MQVAMYLLSQNQFTQNGRLFQRSINFCSQYVTRNLLQMYEHSYYNDHYYFTNSHVGA